MKTRARWTLAVLGGALLGAGCTVSVGDPGAGDEGHSSGLEQKAHDAAELATGVTRRLHVGVPRIAVVGGTGVRATDRGIVLGEDLVRDRSEEALAEIVLLTAGRVYETRTGFVDLMLDEMATQGFVSGELADAMIASEDRVSVTWAALGAWTFGSDPDSPAISDWLETLEVPGAQDWAFDVADLADGMDDFAGTGFFDEGDWLMEGEDDEGWDDAWDDDDWDDDDDWGDLDEDSDDDWDDDWDDDDDDDLDDQDDDDDADDDDADDDDDSDDDDADDDWDDDYGDGDGDGDDGDDGGDGGDEG